MHVSALLQEVIEFLRPTPGKKYIDATIGEAGHARALVERGGEVLGIDEDPSIVAKLATSPAPRQARGTLPRPGEGGERSNRGSKVVQGNFADLKAIAEETGFTEVDGILFDLGMGSHQLDDPERGFSFQKEGPLDMRYDPSGKFQTAADIVNKYGEKELVRLFYNYGEERRFGKKIAQAIVARRRSGTIKTTTELFEFIKHALPGKFRFRTEDVARRIFQSLRIEVNQELQNLEKALPQAVELLKGGGRLAVISFHSLEDRIVKKFFTKLAKDCVCPPDFPVCRCGAKATLRILTKKPVFASLDETKTNSRARSARMRVAEKL